MSARTVDFHLHSNHSDGSDSPRRVVERAANLHLAAIALTDHDTVSGVAEAAAEAKVRGVSLLPGTEISADFDGFETHILGLGVDIESESLLEGLDALRKGRSERAHEIIELLNGAGVAVTRQAVEARAQGAITRMHIATEVKAMGVTRTVQEVFDRFMLKGRPAYVPKTLMPTAEAIERIHAAGGLAFVAHPGLGSTHRRLAKMLQLPFDGIEVLHTAHSAGRTEEFKDLARCNGLLMSGGSDCHGTIKGHGPEMGKVKVPESYYERIQEALAARA